MNLSLSWLRRPTRTSVRHKDSHSRPSLESLEERSLLSITFSGSGNTGAATITGTNAADQFLVRLKSGDPTTIQLSDNGGQSFTDATLDNLTSITINGLQRNDTLTIDVSNGLIGIAAGLPITFSGGTGFGRLFLKGNPSGAGTVTETFTVGSASTPATLQVGNGTISSTISLSSVARITDTMTADTLIYRADDQADLVRLRSGGSVNGTTTNTIQTVSFRSLSNQMIELAEHGVQQTEGQPDDDDDEDSNPSFNGDDSGDHDGMRNQFHQMITSFPKLTFANKTHVTIDTLGGNDLIVVSNAHVAAGMQTLTINGGSGFNVLMGQSTLSGVNVTLNNIQRMDTTAADMFIDMMFEERLERVAGNEELAFWRNILNSSASLNGVAMGIEQSEEAHDVVVKHLYQRLLNREAGGGEERGFVNGLMHGATEEQIEAGILGSEEFFEHAQTLGNPGTNNDQFLQALYQNLLNRTASSAELQSWQQALAQSGRAGVALGFLGSREFRTDIVTLLYNILLGRMADSSGLSFWSSLNTSLQNVRAGFETSREFFEHDSERD